MSSGVPAMWHLLWCQWFSERVDLIKYLRAALLLSSGKFTSKERKRNCRFSCHTRDTTPCSEFIIMCRREICVRIWGGGKGFLKWLMWVMSLHIAWVMCLHNANYTEYRKRSNTAFKGKSCGLMSFILPPRHSLMNILRMQFNCFEHSQLSCDFNQNTSER